MDNNRAGDYIKFIDALIDIASVKYVRNQIKKDLMLSQNTNTSEKLSYVLIESLCIVDREFKQQKKLQKRISDIITDLILISIMLPTSALGIIGIYAYAGSTMGLNDSSSKAFRAVQKELCTKVSKNGQITHRASCITFFEKLIKRKDSRDCYVFVYIHKFSDYRNS